MPTMAMHALLAGGTGLVGGYCLSQLLASSLYESVTTVARRPLGRSADKLEERLVDFTRLERIEPVTAHHAYCCLGTTLRQAGSREAFRAVDFGHVLAFARWARAGGVSHFAAISSLGADARSRVFYSRVKGEAEDALASVGFERLVILRPSLLLGPRRERRVGELIGAAVATAVGPLLVGPVRRYRAIHAETVARAMVRLTMEPGTGVRIVESDELARLGQTG